MDSRRQKTVLLAVGIASAMALLYAAVGRFVLPADPWRWWLDGEQIARDHELFASGVAYYVIYGAASACAVFFAARDLPDMTQTGRCSGAFLGAATLAAIAGLLMARHQGAGALGGIVMGYFWWAFGLIWMATNAISVLAWRDQSTVVARDWALYSAGLAFVPVTALPQLPLWLLLDSMDAHEAALTAVTASFATHYVVVQLYILEGLNPRRRTLPSG